MKNLPARERLDLAEKVAEYLVLAGSLDKTSALEDYDRANALSLELAMLLPTYVYRGMVEAAAHPTGKVNPASVAIMMRKELLVLEEGDLEAAHIVQHAPGPPEDKPRPKAH